MKIIAIAAAAVVLAALSTSASAGVPKFSASCPGGVVVWSSGTGKVKINGQKATVKAVSGTAWKAQAGSTLVDIGQDGSKIYVSAGNEVCEVTKGSSGGNVSSVPAKDQQACLAAVSRQTNNGTVAVLDATTSEANNTVIVGVGKEKARWQCLVKNGHVSGVMSLTNEGSL